VIIFTSIDQGPGFAFPNIVAVRRCVGSEWRASAEEKVLRIRLRTHRPHVFVFNVSIVHSRLSAHSCDARTCGMLAAHRAQRRLPGLVNADN
jgi:hypothetical protein